MEVAINTEQRLDALTYAEHSAEDLRHRARLQICVPAVQLLVHRDARLMSSGRGQLLADLAKALPPGWAKDGSRRRTLSFL